MAQLILWNLLQGYSNENCHVSIGTNADQWNRIENPEVELTYKTDFLQRGKSNYMEERNFSANGPGAVKRPEWKKPRTKTQSTYYKLQKNLTGNVSQI